MNPRDDGGERVISRPTLENSMDRRFKFEYTGQHEDDCGFAFFADVSLDGPPGKHRYLMCLPDSLLNTARAVLGVREKMPSFFTRQGLELKPLEGDKIEVTYDGHTEILKRGPVAFEFLNYHDQMFREAVEKKDRAMLDSILGSQDELLRDEQLSRLYEEFGSSPTEIPKEYKCEL